MYYNNSNRNFLDAYNKALKEQESFEFKQMTEEMGNTTQTMLSEIENDLNGLLTMLDKYEDVLKGGPIFTKDKE
jgi:hypothetical protein